MTEKKNDYRLLLVEDDPNMAYLLQENFKPKGYRITVAGDGRTAYKLFREEKFDLCLLDVMLPKMDGFELAEKIRAIDAAVPIVFLTSKTMESDKIRGFKTGCDDYITKPFSLMELDYRIQAILKRSSSAAVEAEIAPMQRIGSFEFYYHTRILKTTQGLEKKLTRKEAEILKLFCEKKNTLVSRSFLMNHVWGSDDYFISKSMDVYLTRVRQLLKEDPRLELQNVYGSGYLLVEKETG